MQVLLIFTQTAQWAMPKRLLSVNWSVPVLIVRMGPHWARQHWDSGVGVFSPSPTSSPWLCSCPELGRDKGGLAYYSDDCRFGKGWRLLFSNMFNVSVGFSVVPIWWINLIPPPIFCKWILSPYIIVFCILAKRKNNIKIFTFPLFLSPSCSFSHSSVGE